MKQFRRPAPNLIFITGTDTGVGKTVLTSLLLTHLHQIGVPAFALKPFCSGGRSDAEILHQLQDGELTLDEINPFHFPEPVAPLVAARLHRRKIPLRAALACIQTVVRKLRTKHSKLKTPAVLLIEGAGGLLAPLGEPGYSRITHSSSKALLAKEDHASRHIYSALDLITALSRQRQAPHAPRITHHVVVVAPNRLGTINHTRLTVDKLRDAGVKRLTVTLMDLHSPRHATPDMRHNRLLLSELSHLVPVIPLPYLGKSPNNPRVIRYSARRLSKILGQISTG